MGIMKKSELKKIIKGCIQEVGIGRHGFAPLEEAKGGTIGYYIDMAVDELNGARKEAKMAKNSAVQKKLNNIISELNKLKTEASEE